MTTDYNRHAFTAGLTSLYIEPRYVAIFHQVLVVFFSFILLLVLCQHHPLLNKTMKTKIINEL